jgi:hypothetical protein
MMRDHIITNGKVCTGDPGNPSAAGVAILGAGIGLPEERTRRDDPPTGTRRSSTPPRPVAPDPAPRSGRTTA